VRSAFIDTLTTLAKADPRVTLLVGDLGFSVVEGYAEALPRQYLNAGVAEQNMTGLAAGLALGVGRCVFTYSIANFNTMRCLEQIRHDVCYHRADVKVVAVGGGVTYGNQGYTHFAVEDLAIMSALPGMVVAAPADAAEARLITELAVASPGPWYLRLGRDGEPALHADGLERLDLGALVPVRQGSAGAVLAVGPLAVQARQAVDLLAGEGHPLALFSVPFIKPLDTDAIRQLARNVPFLLTVEEHSGNGGLGSAVAGVLAEMGGAPPLVCMHLPERHDVIGTQAFLREHHGLDAAGIEATLRRVL